jgi:hypothetical protein
VAEPSLPPYNVGDLGGSVRRTAPAAARNMAPIEAVLRDWLPATGTILEVASGTGEHALAYASAFPALVWQPSDPDPLALASITDWSRDGPPNLRPPLQLDAAADWPVDRADAILSINMVHIALPEAGLGLLDGASRLLPPGGPLILYGPWLEDGVAAAPSNLAFDADLKARNPEWGLRTVESFAAEAESRGLDLVERRAMPANNLMLLFRRGA